MINPFEYLRIQTQGLLPEPWYNYPVVIDYEVETIISVVDETVQLYHATQDDYHVIGISVKTPVEYKSFCPGRKWGQFGSRKDAKLWALGHLLCTNNLLSNAAIASIRIEIYRTSQMSLF